MSVAIRARHVPEKWLEFQRVVNADCSIPEHCFLF